MRVEVSGSQHRILLAIIRESYGRGQKSAVLSYADIERLTGVHRNAVSREFNRLEAGRYIVRSSNGANKPNTLSIQKDYTKWAGMAASYSETAVSDIATSKSATYSETAVTAVSETAVRPYSETAVTPHTPLYGERNLKKALSSAGTLEGPATHPAVAAYRTTLDIRPNEQQRKVIAETVTDLDRWQVKLDRWKTNGYSPKNLTGLLDSYTSPDPQTNGAGRSRDRPRVPLPEDPHLTMAEVKAASAANIRRLQARGELPDDWPIPTGY